MKNLIIYTLVGLSLFLIFQLHQSKQSTRHLTEEISYYTDSLHTYTSLYPSASFNSLKRENKELYNEVKRLKDLKEVIKYKYRTEYRTDTIYISNPSDEVINKDTTYRLSNETDSISYSLLANVTGKLNYYKLYFKLSDTFKISNSLEYSQFQVNINFRLGSYIRFYCVMLTPACKKEYLPFVIQWIRDSLPRQAPINFTSKTYCGRSRTSL